MSTCTVHGRNVNTRSCPVVELSRYVGDFWNLWIFRVLLQKPHRFGELQKKIDQINKATLVAKLQLLIEAGLVKKSLSVDGKIEYDLTDVGKKLEPIVTAVSLVAKEVELS